MNWSTLLPKVVDTAKMGGDFIRSQSEKFKWDKLEYKGDNDLVSYVDKEAERLLVKSLTDLLPEAGFITEEGTVANSHTPLQWVIDPLDGTTNFVHGIPMYSVSVALLSDQIPVLGVVYEVTRDECFYACQGGKAYCNENEISVAPIRSLSESVLATGYPQVNFDRLKEYLAILEQLMQQTHGLRRMGSAAVDLAYVACGRVSAFFEHNLNVYDVAAGVIIVQQAGGVITDFKGAGDYLWGREILAANGVHHELLKTIRRHWQ